LAARLAHHAGTRFPCCIAVSVGRRVSRSVQSVLRGPPQDEPRCDLETVECSSRKPPPLSEEEMNHWESFDHGRERHPALPKGRLDRASLVFRDTDGRNGDEIEVRDALAWLEPTIGVNAVRELP